MKPRDEFYSLSNDQEAIKESVKKICDQFSPQYWRDLDKAGEFPEDFVKAITDGGWLGIAMPEYGSVVGIAASQYS